MAKRANPFVEDYIPQSKIHIGLKQFNNNDDRLKKVYEQTLDLLFKGAKKSVVQGASNDPDTTFNRKDKMKQLFIGKNGTLQNSGSLVQNNVEVKQCSCGMRARAVPLSLESRCAYCEQALCGACQHGCTRCDNAHCTRCILAGSEGSEVCLSCYG